MLLCCPPLFHKELFLTLTIALHHFFLRNIEPEPKPESQVLASTPVSETAPSDSPPPASLRFICRSLSMSWAWLMSTSMASSMCPVCPLLTDHQTMLLSATEVAELTMIPM